jgi:hypothetical protein
MIIKINDTTFIKYDEKTKQSITVDVGFLSEKKKEIESRLKEIDDYSDKNLLAWAKINYPTPEGLREKEQLDRELQSITNQLNEIDGN